MDTYLITGVAGFIGSSLARAILSRGGRVRAVDNFSTGNRENIADILKQIDFIEGDIRDARLMREACEGTDYVLHQAAIPSVPKSVKDPVTTNSANVDGTLQVLVAAKECKVKRVVYAASSSAYGDTPTLPKREDMTPNPISPYAVSKLTGELYMRSFYHVYGLETVSLRYFNVFGPRQDPNSPYSGVLARFIHLLLREEQPTIFGDGEQSRDFTYVDDVVEANLKACSASAAQVAGGIFNVGTGERASLNEVFKVLKTITNFSGAPIYGSERAGDVKHSLADISLAKKHLAYRPRVPLREGLRLTVNWYKQQNRLVEMQEPPAFSS